VRAGDRCIRHFHWDAVRNDVDQTAGGPAAIQQGRRPFDDFDLLRDDGLQRHGVIRTQARNIQGLEPVLQHLHAIAAEATNDGSACGRTEVRGADAKLLRQRLADAAGDLSPQFIAREHLRGLGNFERALPQGS
jgi:hypothetical protein